MFQHDAGTCKVKYIQKEGVFPLFIPVNCATSSTTIYSSTQPIAIISQRLQKPGHQLNAHAKPLPDIRIL